ncbi:MAG: hypothetical protein KJ804_16290 [Proteobacteria bacterium]|nr:hypothetical protein [Pseudomonadota bacterium]
MSGDIFLTIDTIVLRGFKSIDRQALTEAVQQALTEQLSGDRELKAMDLARVRTDITLPTSFAAEQLGQTLGQRLSGIITGDEATTQSAHETKPGGRHHA